MSVAMPLPRVASRSGAVGTAPADAGSWLPPLAVVGALGLLVIAVGNTQSRAGQPDAELLFWAGLVLLVLPVTARLASVSASRSERLGLVTLFGLALYFVKVMHSPMAFTFPDELIQLYNTNRILESGALFSRNSILPITPYYPGISMTAAILGELGGYSIFGAALVLMAVARVVLVWSLFLLHEQVSGSARVAGIAAVLYAANPNFVFVGAGFIYESLALPLAAMVLYAVARRGDLDNTRLRIVLTVTAMVAIVTVAVTHHVTSWALLAFLLAASAIATFRRLIVPAYRQPERRPLVWGLAILCGVIILAWLVYVATSTVGYLAPVFRGAFSSVLRLIVAEETGRQMFQSASGQVAPLAERFVGIGSVLLIVLGLPFGLWQVVWNYRANAFALTLAGAALTYFPMLGLRFTPAGWETGHRSSEFLYVGISFILALGLVKFRPPAGLTWAVPIVVASYVMVIFAGGTVASFPRALRLPPPYVTAVEQKMIEPEGVVAARWTQEALGSGHRFAASNSNANLLLAYGEQDALWGSNMGLQSMFLAPDINQSVLDILKVADVQYLFTDRRRISWDLMFGLYVSSSAELNDPRPRYIEASAISKFDTVNGASRIFDSGNIVIYDVEEVVRVSRP